MRATASWCGISSAATPRCCNGRSIIAPAIFGSVAAAVVVAAIAAYLMPRSFLPPFNEGTLLVSRPVQSRASRSRNRTGSASSPSGSSRRCRRCARSAAAPGAPSSTSMPRACTTASSISISNVRRAAKEEVFADIRARLSVLPVSINIGQPIAHRLDHMLSGVRAQIALKIYGEDLDTLRRLAETMRERLAGVAGLVDLQVEKQVLIPQVRIHLDYERAALYGMTPAAVSQALEAMSNGRRVSQIVEGNRRFDVVMRLGRPGSLDHRPRRSPDRDAVRPCAAAAAGGGRGRRRSQPDPARERAAAHRRVRQWRRQARHGRDRRRHPPRRGARSNWPQGYTTQLEGTFQAQEEATLRIGAAVAVVARAGLHRALQPLQFDRAGADHHGEHPARPDRQRDRALYRRPAAVDRVDDRLHHARRHLGAQRHPQDLPLHQPGAATRASSSAARWSCAARWNA